MKRSILQDGLHTQAITYRMGGDGKANTGQISQIGHYVVMKRSIQDELHMHAIIYRMGGV